MSSVGVTICTPVSSFISLEHYHRGASFSVRLTILLRTGLNLFSRRAVLTNEQRTRNLSRRFIVATIASSSAGAFAFFFLVGAVFCAATLHVSKRLGRTPLNAETVSVFTNDKVNLSAWWLRPA